MIDFSFLDNEQVFGDNQIDILKKYGTKAAITDFSILLGGDVSNIEYISSDSRQKTGFWWLKDTIPEYIEMVDIVTDDGRYKVKTVYSRCIGARPSFDASSFFSKFDVLDSSDDVLRVSFGEYPQMVADAKTCKELTNLLFNHLLIETGRVYMDITGTDKNGLCYERRNFEYEYDGNKYVGIVGDKYSENSILSNGRKVVERQLYWIRVEPIIWLVDKKTNIALSEKILFSGVQFCSVGKYDRDFNNTHIKWFMDNYFAKEIVSSKNLDNNLPSKSVKTKGKKSSAKKIKVENPYKFNLDSVTEDNIIRGCIKSSVPVFLHGASSEGKSARVKQIDPKLVKLSLAGITPEKLNGRSVYNSVKDIMEDKKPTWLERLEEICASEPDENHILFLDELSNALPSIQGMVYHLVLDREVNDRWKLPDNARIVLAGNEMKDSLAANKVVEPLFNRCAHVYIKTDLKDWLVWASENRLHPSIISFMIYTKGKYLRSKFDGEKPNADPRKWEMASKILYKTKKPEMIRALVGEKITHEFCKFCNQKIISLGDVLNGNYDHIYLNSLDVQAIYAIIVELCKVDIDKVKLVRDFLNYFGEDYVNVFDLIYCFDSKEKMNIISEMKINKKVKKK
ncbi:MAG: ATP-binding protein [Bacilli bacterium]